MSNSLKGDRRVHVGGNGLKIGLLKALNKIVYFDTMYYTNAIFVQDQ